MLSRSNYEQTYVDHCRQLSPSSRAAIGTCELRRVILAQAPRPGSNRSSSPAWCWRSTPCSCTANGRSKARTATRSTR